MITYFLLFFINQDLESVNVASLVSALTLINGAIVTPDTMIGCGMEEKLLRRNICQSELCTLVTLVIHWIEKRGDSPLAHLNGLLHRQVFHLFVRKFALFAHQ